MARHVIWNLTGQALDALAEEMNLLLAKMGLG